MKFRAFHTHTVGKQKNGEDRWKRVYFECRQVTSDRYCFACPHCHQEFMLNVEA